MHPEFIAEIGRQYQSEARERASAWRLARAARKHRKEERARGGAPSAPAPESEARPEPVSEKSTAELQRVEAEPLAR